MFDFLTNLFDFLGEFIKSIHPLVIKILKFCIWLGCIGVFSAILLVDGMFLYLDPKNPDPETYRNHKPEHPLRVFSADGALLAEFGSRRVIPIKDIAEVPQDYLDAVVAIEDKRFYTHSGIDWFSLARNTFAHLIGSKNKGGASTITMQLPRNVADLSREKTLIRKFRELLLALQIERELSKDEILKLYVNVIPFGKHAYGVQAAAYTYYDKPVHELSLAQLAMLAGIPNRPEKGNPINDPEWAKQRRNVVLKRMFAEKFINDEEYEIARAEPVTARAYGRKIDLQSSYPAELARQEIEGEFGKDIYTGYTIYTTIDVDHQHAAQQAVKTELQNYDHSRGYRGPERRINVDPNSLDLTTTFINELREEKPIGPLEPAVVTAVDEQSFDAILKDDSEVTVHWDGISWARRSYGSSGVGSRPSVASDVVAVGHLVRLQYVSGRWYLTQVPEVQGAIVAVVPRTGAITAMVGGYDFEVTQYNHATQAARQPGSGFKPFVYTAALANGVTPATIFLDAPLIFDDSSLETPYRPRNFSGDYRGPTRLREALYESINLVSIRVLEHIGASKVQDYVSRFGFPKHKLPNNTQLAIGGGNMGMSPLELATAYAVIANGGYRVRPHLIQKVVTHAGETVFEPLRAKVCNSCGHANTGFEEEVWHHNANYELEVKLRGSNYVLEAKNVLDPRLAFLMDSMLRDVARVGTAERATVTLGRKDLAGKTGTTNDAVDTWFNGYQQNLVATAWVGYSDRRSLGEREYGSTRPLSIWIEFMQEALREVPEFVPEPPDGIVSVYVDSTSGEVVHAAEPNAMLEYFLSETAPSQESVVGSRDEQELVDPEDIF